MDIRVAVLPSQRRRARGRRPSWRGGLVQSDDQGFSIIEILIAIGVFSLVGVFTLSLTGAGLRGVLLGKRREVATAEANRLTEVARSLSYNSVGLVSADSTIASDTAIQNQGGVLKYQAGTQWEPIVWSTGGGTNPFNPHSTALSRGSTSLTRYVYITGVDADSDGTIDYKRLTVRVTWNNTGAVGPANEVRAQTLIHPNGLAQGGPLTPIKTDTFATGGNVGIKTARGAIAGLVNAVLPLDPVTLQLPTSSGGVTYRAVSTVNCTGQSTSLNGLSSSYGGHPVSVTADDDAQTSVGTQPSSQTWSGTPTDAISGGDDVDHVLTETALNSPVSCAATAADSDGVAPTDDGLPYEKGTASSLGTLNMTEDLTGLGLGSNLLTAVAVQTSPLTQEIDHQIVSSNREAYANTTGALGMVNVLKIPGVFADGLVRVDSLSYGASARGAETTPSAAPTVTAPVINLRVYDVANQIPNPTCASRSGGYCIISVNPSAPGFTGLTIDFSHNVVLNLGLTNLSYQIHVDILPPAKDPIAGVTGANGEKRWSAEYNPVSVSAGLTSDLTVPLVGHVILTNTSVDLNLGSVRAEACAGVACL